MRFQLEHRRPGREELAFPYQLLEFANLPPDAQREYADHFFTLPPCELDYFSLALRNLVGTPEGLLEGSVIQSLRRCASFASMHTQVLEAKHGRRRQYRAARNQVRGLKHQCAQFIIREARRLQVHDLRCMPKTGREYKKAKKKSKQRKKLNFIAQCSTKHRQKHGKCSKEEFVELRRCGL